MNRNKYYTKALEETKLYHTQPEGLTTVTPTSQVDTVVIKQNNIIIILLLQILQKLEDITEKPESSKVKIDEDIDNLIQGIKKLEISKPVSRIPKQYTFGAFIKPEKYKAKETKNKEIKENKEGDGK